MVGIPTILCLVAAFVLRLNPAALQLLNSVASPLQVLLLLPLARIGSRLLGGGVAAGSWAERLGLAALHAIAGWALVCIPLGVLLYIGLVLIMRRAHAMRAA